MSKLPFKGVIISLQPRIRLMRSFDERSHNYLGYVLLIKGVVDGDERQFSVGIGKSTQQKHQFCVRDEVSGECLTVADEKLEPVEFYKASKLKKVNPAPDSTAEPPPWKIVPPSLEVYRERGHRRLAAQTYTKKCISCIWGCRMPVEIIIDHWNPGKRKYRFETFCYGRDAYEIMVGFAKTLDDPDISEELFDALDGRGAFRRFKNVVKRYPQIEEQWYKYKNEFEKQEVREWLWRIGIEPLEVENNG